MDSIVPTPRFVTCIKHDAQYGNVREFSWDQEKISVNPDFADDVLMLQNVFEAKIISSSIFPLIFEIKAPLKKEITLRSLEFFREVQQDNSLYQKLSSEEKTHFFIGLRDLFVASCRNLLSEDEEQLLKNIVDLVDPFDDDPDIVTKKILNLDVTPYPTSNHKMVKFLDISTEETLLDECFIRNELNLLVAFVDPRDLSYHNFENIVNLNSLFDPNFARFKMTNLQKYKDHDVFTFDMIDKAGILKALDKCGLYVQPLNKVSRGGGRFIFSSETLSRNLYEGIVHYMKHPKLTNKKFRFVNYVFRYNKFRPGDKKFISHYDTPYHDPSRKHHSKYTLLLYLTSGSADPVLSFGDVKLQIKSIDTKGEIKGIIFDQKYEHEGKAYLEGDKIFVRSELIYEYDDEDFTVNNEVSKMFNIACYMTKQSLFTPEVDQYASEVFNQAAKARVNMTTIFDTKEVLLYKKYQNNPFITNGYDYWFKKTTSLKTAARFAIMDHFNCKLDIDKVFNKRVSQEVIKMNSLDINKIFDFLENHQEKVIDGKRGLPPMEDNVRDKQEEEEDRNENEGVISPEENEEIVEPATTKKLKLVQTKLSQYDRFKHLYFPPYSEIQHQDEDQDSNSNKEEEDYVDENCCYKHADDFNPFKCKSVQELKKELTAVQTKKKTDLQKQHTIMILDKQVELPAQNIIVKDNIISFNGTIPRFNFASFAYQRHMELLQNENAHVCWVYGKHKRADFVDSITKPVTLYDGLPSIPYQVLDRGYHLRLEIFRNNLIRKTEDTLEEYFIMKVP